MQRTLVCPSVVSQLHKQFPYCTPNQLTNKGSFSVCAAVRGVSSTNRGYCLHTHKSTSIDYIYRYSTEIYRNGCSSVVRALTRFVEGRGFESHPLHIFLCISESLSVSCILVVITSYGRMRPLQIPLSLGYGWHVQLVRKETKRLPLGTTTTWQSYRERLRRPSAMRLQDGW